MPRHTQGKSSIVFTIPPEQHQRLKVLAARDSRTLSGLIRVALADYLRREYLEDIQATDLAPGKWGGPRE